MMTSISHENFNDFLLPCIVSFVYTLCDSVATKNKMHWWIVLALAATALADPLLFSNNMIHFPTRTVVKTESKQEPLKGWPIRESRPTHAHRPTYVPVHKGPHPIQHSHSKVDPIVAAQHLAKIGATLNIPAFQQIGGFMIGGADLFGGVTTLGRGSFLSLYTGPFSCSPFFDPSL